MKVYTDSLGRFRAFKSRIMARLIIRYGEHYGGLMGSLVLGNQEFMNEERAQNMGDLGIMHILSISGFHFNLLENALKKLKLKKIAPYIQGVMLGSYLSWNFGTVIGILFGSILPGIVAEGMEIAIFTLFITLLLNTLNGNSRLMIIPIISMITNYIASNFLPGGLSILLSIIAGSSAGMLIKGDEEDE